VLDVALERDEDGHAAYREVLVSVPRQSGKSSLALALLVSVMLETPGASLLYGAQSRQAARERLLNSWWPRLSTSPLKERARLFRGFGNESLSIDGSSLQLLSSSPTSGHGETVTACVVDEAWAHQDSRVEQAVRPAMLTKRDAQLWAMSTAGDATSVWWKEKTEAGRAAVDAGLNRGVAYFEWGADPDADPGLESTWTSAMPALGHLVDVDTVRTDFQAMAPAEFARAMLNVWPDPAGEGWQVISRDVWTAAEL
jgi:phage terminase large subunit-like protein